MTASTTAIERRFTRECQRFAHKFDSGITTPETMREFVAFYAPALARLRRSAGVAPVPVNGSRARGLRAGYFRAPLRDGTSGYLQRRTDDCLQAAIASCLQIPPYLVPDLRIDEQRLAGADPEAIERAIWEKLSGWMDKRGVTIMLHPMPPASGRWIGVVPAAGAYSDHCLLMSDRDCLFDPSVPLPVSGHQDATDCDLADIDYGITIEKR